jgi:hypothetical protein
MLAVLGAAYARRLAASKNLSAAHLLLFLIGIGLPTVVYIMSVWGPKPLFADRQLLGAAVAFVAIIGLCMATLPRSMAAGFLLILLAWTATGTPQAFPHNTKPPWCDMAAQIDTQYNSMIVVAQESWVSQPLTYYRRAGSIRRWSELEEDEKGDRLLFVCRPFMCSDVETEALKSRSSLLATWRWRTSEELRLYEIRSEN